MSQTFYVLLYQDPGWRLVDSAGALNPHGIDGGPDVVLVLCGFVVFAVRCFRFSLTLLLVLVSFQSCLAL